MRKEEINYEKQLTHQIFQTVGPYVHAVETKH